MHRKARILYSINTVIVEESVGSAFMIGMRVDESSNLCYAHGFNIADKSLVEKILVSLEMLNGRWGCLNQGDRARQEGGEEGRDLTL